MDSILQAVRMPTNKKPVRILGYGDVFIPMLLCDLYNFKGPIRLYRYQLRFSTPISEFQAKILYNALISFLAPHLTYVFLVIPLAGMIMIIASVYLCELGTIYRASFGLEGEQDTTWFDRGRYEGAAALRLVIPKF
jgi:hypothetical protein